MNSNVSNIDNCNLGASILNDNVLSSTRGRASYLDNTEINLDVAKRWGYNDSKTNSDPNATFPLELETERQTDPSCGPASCLKCLSDVDAYSRYMKMNKDPTFKRHGSNFFEIDLHITPSFMSIGLMVCLCLNIILLFATTEVNCMFCYENFKHSIGNAVLIITFAFLIVSLIITNHVCNFKKLFKNPAMAPIMAGLLILNIKSVNATLTLEMRGHRSYCLWDVAQNLSDLDTITHLYNGTTTVLDLVDTPLCDHKDPHFIENTVLHVTEFVNDPDYTGALLTISSPKPWEQAFVDPNAITMQNQTWSMHCIGDSYYKNFEKHDHAFLTEMKVYMAYRRVGGTPPYITVLDIPCQESCVQGLNTNLTCAEKASCNATMDVDNDFCSSYILTKNRTCISNASLADCLVQPRYLLDGISAHNQGDLASDTNLLALNNKNGTIINYENLVFGVSLGYPATYYLSFNLADANFNVEITKNNEIIYFRTHGTLNPGENMTAIIRKGIDTDIIVITDVFQVWPIPGKYFHQSGSMLITVFKGNTIVGSAKFNIVAFHSCNIYQCTSCWEAWYNWGCLPMTTKIASVLMLIIMFGLACCVVPAFFFLSMNTVRYIFYIFGAITNCLWNVSKVPTYRNLKEKTSSMFSNIKSAMTPQEEEEMIGRLPMDKLRPDQIETVRDKPFFNIMTRNATKIELLIMFILMICLNIVATCDSGLVIPVSITDCIKNGKTETCVIDLELNGIIPNLGAVNCFSISDKTDVIALITVEYIALQGKVPLIDQYYTSGFELNYESHYICHDSPGFILTKCKGSFCADVNPTDTNVEGILKSPMTKNFPGETKCLTTDGCWAKGCFDCHDACVVERWGLNPQGEVTIITQPGGVVFTPMMRLNVTTHQVTQSYLFNVQGKSFLTNGFRTTILGTLSGPTPDLTGIQKFMKVPSQNAIFIVDASDTNTPVGWGYGAIQASSVNGLLHPSPTSFIYSKDIVDAPTVVNKRVVIDYTKFSGVDYFSLPSTVKGNYWVYDGIGNIVTNFTENSALEYEIDTPKGVSITRTISNICPTITGATAKGCFACLAGAEILITAKSTCESGLVSVSVSGQNDIVLFTVALKLEVVDSIQLIRFSTESITNDFTLTLGGTFENASIDMSFIAYSGITINNETTSGGNGTVIDKSGHQKWDDWITKGFKGLGDWWHTFLLYFGIFIIIILSFLICSVAYRINKMILKPAPKME